jgi:hypothetical protein
MDYLSQPFTVSELQEVMPPDEFTEQVIEDLITEVKGKPVLWNQVLDEYRNAGATKSAWEVIGSSLGKTGNNRSRSDQAIHVLVQIVTQFHTVVKNEIFLNAFSPLVQI